MALSVEAKKVLFEKVPEYEAENNPELDWQKEFLNRQLEDLKKSLFREYVTIWKANKWAESDDERANKAAEQVVPNAIDAIKSIKLEIEGLKAIPTEPDSKESK